MTSTIVEWLGPPFHFSMKYKNSNLAFNLVKNLILYWTAKTISYSNYNFDQQIGRDFERVIGLIFEPILIWNPRILSQLQFLCGPLLQIRPQLEVGQGPKGLSPKLLQECIRFDYDLVNSWNPSFNQVSCKNTTFSS